MDTGNTAQGHAAGKVLQLRVRQASPLPHLSLRELFTELRAKEDALLDDEQEFVAIAEAVWPDDGPGEEPLGFREFRQFERSEIVAGIESLHELIERLMHENERLRFALCAKEQRHA